MIIPKSKWYPKQDGYIKGEYMYQEVDIEVESIMISYDNAYVTFNYGMRRITLDAIEFRRRFGKQNT